MADAVRYAILLGVLWVAVSHGGDWLLHNTVRSFDPVVMTLPIDDAVVETHRVAGSRNPSGSADGDDAVADDTSDVQFDHARPAPRLFERVSIREAEKIKAAVRETVVAEGSEGWYHGSGGTYRTVCVRLCDGAYFPVSFSTTRNWFNRDEAVCKSKCGAPARLFVAPNPGGSPENMRDRQGASYIALPTAFQFRKGAVSGCSCRAEAWETASLERHRGYEAAATGITVAAGSTVGNAALASRGVMDAPPQQSRPAPSRVAGWESTRDLAATANASAVVGAVSTSQAETPALAVTMRAAFSPPAAAPIAVAKLDMQKPADVKNPAVDAFVSRNAEGIVTAALAAPPEATVQRPALAERALKPLPPQVLVKARAVKSASKRPGGNKRKPSPQDELDLATSAAPVPPFATTHLQKASPTWGVGPNSRAAPRGHSAYDVFARNFY